jgi:hypothetical protein
LGTATGSGALLDLGTVLDLPFSVTLENAEPVPGLAGRYQVWFDADGGLETLAQYPQLYALVDPRDVADELNETNNLVCLNCRAPGQSPNDAQGVIVRFRAGTPVSTLFPAEYQKAAAKLPTAHRVAFQPKAYSFPKLGVRMTPPVP